MYTKVSDIRGALAGAKNVGLVPTMGALHAGHEALIQHARKDSDVVVVSIFVNPLQFGPTEDYSKYPRALPRDLEICERNGANFVFAPPVEEMYPRPQLTFVDVARVSEHLCGAFRPGHFRGVATVVLKLFNIIQPDRAYFGEKDMQQLAVIRRMVRDLMVPIEIIGVPTVREADGLAISSRNQYLSAAERKAAPVLHRALQAASRLSDVEKMRETAMDILRSEPLVRVEYLEVVDAVDMQPLTVLDGPARIATAVWIGNTRLIDNHPL